MAEEMKLYEVHLNEDLLGWGKTRVVAMTVIKFGQGKPAQLKEEFEVKDDPASEAPGILNGFLEISDKEILPTKDGVRFNVTVPPSVDWRQLENIDHFLLEVEVKLDLSMMAGAARQVMGAMGMGWAGAAVPTEMGLIAGTCAVKVEIPKFTISLRKFRWDGVEKKDLRDYVSADDLAHLHSDGGELWVPVKAQKEQSEKDSTIFFDDIAVCDVEGELDWKGAKIPGTYKDDEDPKHEYIIFEIKGKMYGASDLAPGSPTRGPGGFGTV